MEEPHQNTDRQENNRKHTREKVYDRAVVVGGGIAGLVAARILAGHFAQVTIVERDLLPDLPDFRPGVPQAYHAHTILPQGQAMLEQLFPGLAEQLMAKGAIPMTKTADTALFLSGAWRKPPESFAVAIVGCSRPLLETTLYQRLAVQPQIRIIQEYEVGGLAADNRVRRATGVKIRHRHDILEGESILPADLVVNASGRYSHAPHWLQALGYPPPLDTIVDALAGYASRIYQRPADFAGDWQAMYIRPAPQNSSRGGIILPLEGDRWQVTLIGMANDHPPTSDEDFLAFARTLPTDRLYEAIKNAQPLTSVHGYRLTANRLRGYDRLSRYLEGFVAIGDAVHTMNPVYAQGVTLAAGDSLALDRVLKAHRRQQGVGDLTSLASTFQKELRKELTSSWRLGTREDCRCPSTIEIQDFPSTGHSTILTNLDHH